MSSHCYGIYGAGGHGSELLIILKQYLKKINSTINLKNSLETFNTSNLFFIDDNVKCRIFHEHSVLALDEFLNLDFDLRSLSISVGDGKKREKIYQKIDGKTNIIDIISDDLIKSDNTTFGIGAAISQKCLITTNYKIGIFFQCNADVHIHHDCVIGNYVTLGPSVKIMGNVEVGDYSYIGAGAVIKQGVKIGKNCIIGIGSVVISDVISNTTVVGNPAKNI